MSKTNENDSLTNNQGNPDLSGQTENKKGKPEIPTIEELAQKQNIGAPVFAAVMQSKKWASGKRVPEAVFQQAVKEFLSAPMGGKK